jgi:uncharacterized membrane protein
LSAFAIYFSDISWYADADTPLILMIIFSFTLSLIAGHNSW